MARFYRHLKKKRKGKGELGDSWVLTLGKFLLGSVLLPDSYLELGRGGVVCHPMENCKGVAGWFLALRCLRAESVSSKLVFW